MGEKRLLAILGSPHRDGATAKMLECAVSAAQAAGWSVEKVWLYEKKLAYCRGCRVCNKTGECVLKDDDGPALTASLKSCDAVALAAPCYWANVPAVVKNFFDRTVGVAMEDVKTIPKPRLSRNQKYLLLTACGTPAPFDRLGGQSTGVLHAMREYFKTAGMKPLGSVAFPGTKKRSELPEVVKRKIERYLA